uniref:Uncharacterized protein n=1 Tax=Seriola lalandi dorsalis TaxID=1841481 RepID=A0A3B4YH30_SERLL
AYNAITLSLSLYYFSFGLPLDKYSNNHNLYIYVFNNKYISAYEIVHWMLSPIICLCCVSRMLFKNTFLCKNDAHEKYEAKQSSRGKRIRTVEV